jgi:hypothetical protein
MAMISRNWQCLANRCRNVFHSYEHNPECPKCGTVKVGWVPGGGHIGGLAPSADATLRSLATDYGMDNLNSPSHSRVNRAMPQHAAPPVDKGYGLKHFAPGFSGHVFDKATCAASLSPVDVRGTQPIGRTFSAAKTIPGPIASTNFEGRHAGK